MRSLSEVVAGRVQGRVTADNITLFESQGIALEDIAAGVRIYELAKGRGMGRELPF